jgi:soluble lytic murein transglycosylase
LNLPQNDKVKWIQLAIDKATAAKFETRIPEMQKRLYRIAPRLDPAPHADQLPEVAQDFRMARKFTQANELYEKIIASKSYTLDDKINAFKGLRLSYKNSRQNESHLGIAKRLVEFLQKNIKKKTKRPILPLLYDAQIYLARALWTQGDPADAGEVLTQIEKKMKGRMSLAELYWIRGRLCEEKGDTAGVSNWMDLALKEKITNPDLRDKILWYAGWNQRQLKDSVRAGDIFKELREQTKSDVVAARATYWYGRCLTDQGKTEEATKTFEELMNIDPLGYYGMLAHQQRAVTISMPQLSPVANPDLSPVPSAKPQYSEKPGAPGVDPSPINLELADWLYWTNEKEILTAYLDYASTAYRKSKNQDEDEWTTIFKHYAKAGLYVKLYENLGTLDGEKRKSILEHHPDLLFPQPFQEDVRTASLQFGVDEEFIYAIMRQESAFNPRARSGADAFGLMQVLPEVGRQISENYKIPYTDMDDLFDPKTNISVGAAHIKELLSRHKGQFILAVASYNASENAIRNWMKNRFRGDSLEFIEEIPYEETRNYVRLVMRNMIFYRLLKSKSAAIEFPAWVLKLDNNS